MQQILYLKDTGVFIIFCGCEQKHDLVTSISSTNHVCSECYRYINKITYPLYLVKGLPTNVDGQIVFVSDTIIPNFKLFYL